MPDLHPDLKSHLLTGTTTLCNCWKLTPRGKSPLGFTDHDVTLSFEGVVYEAAAGFTASAIEAQSGLAVDNLDVIGALESDKLNDADLAVGVFDDAEIEIWRVNWQQPEARVLLRKGNIGEVARGTLGFRAEVRGLAHRLNQASGRLFQYACDTELGSSRCGINLTDALYQTTATVTSIVGEREFILAGASSYADQWFTRGVVDVNTGENSGRQGEIKEYQKNAETVRILLWHPMPKPIVIGDEMVLTAGCDKNFSTCKSKFSNGARFQGFPHMPGNDYVVSYPSKGGAYDGGSRNGGA
jgi:uncharacterized phage protein (TIGR02218 family)